MVRKIKSSRKKLINGDSTLEKTTIIKFSNKSRQVILIDVKNRFKKQDI